MHRGTIKWTSSDTSIATVSSSGVVTGVKAGTVTITAKHANISTSDTCTVNVKDVIIVQMDNIKSKPGAYKHYTLEEKYQPAGIITWSSSDTSVATIDSAGKVTCLKAGTTKITATHESGLSDSRTLHVEDIVINNDSVDVNKGKTVMLSAGAYAPSDTTWVSYSPNIATITSSGVVTGIKGGTATIRASSSSQNLSDSVKVNVKDIVFKETSVDVNRNSTVKLELEDYAPSGTITWTSSDTSVVTVDANGIVTGVKAGTVRITAEHADSDLSDICTVNVKDVKLEYTSVGVYKGKTIQLSLEDYAPSGEIRWTSDNVSVATVNKSTGLVTGVSSGIANITATHIGSGLSYTGRVVVRHVDIEESDLVLTQGDEQQFSLKDYAPPASEVTWTSSDTSVVTVDSTGLVTVKSLGTTTITATHTETGLKDTCKIIVPGKITWKPSGESSIASSYLKITVGGYGKDYAFNYSVISGATLSFKSSNSSLVTVEPIANAPYTDYPKYITIRSTTSLSLTDAKTVTITPVFTYNGTKYSYNNQKLTITVNPIS